MNEEMNGEDEFQEIDINEYTNQLSEYELARLENIKSNNEKFEEYKIMEAKNEVYVAKKRKVSMEVVGLASREKITKKTKEELFPQRKSLRIMKIKAEAPELPRLANTLPWKPFDEWGKQKPAELPMKTVNEMEEVKVESAIKSWINVSNKEFNNSNIDCKDYDADLQSYKERMSSLTISDIGKVTKKRIYSLAFHPTKEKMIVCGGDKDGAVGIWDVNCGGGKDEVFLFAPHSRPVNCLKFSPFDNTKIFSCSFDGTLTCGDFNKMNFHQIYAYEPHTSGLTYFAFPKDYSNTVLASVDSGDLLVMDLLTGKAEHTHELNRRSMRCVDCHPLNEHLIATSFIDGSLSTWDLRMLKKIGSKSLSSFRAPKTVITSFFSPKTGNKLLMTSQDDYIRVFDVDKSGILAVPPRNPIRHKYYYGRWLTTFRAAWDPKTDHCFVCGSMEQPRQIDMFACGKLGGLTKFRLRNENLTHISSVNVLHPQRDILASCNSSGRVNIWSLPPDK